MLDTVNIDTLEKAIRYITREMKEAQREVDKVTDKYSRGGMYSTEDASDESYFEGKVTGLEYALWALEQLKGK